jgi:hypothetical protein
MERRGGRGNKASRLLKLKTSHFAQPVYLQYTDFFNEKCDQERETKNTSKKNYGRVSISVSPRINFVTLISEQNQLMFTA